MIETMNIEYAEFYGYCVKEEMELMKIKKELEFASKLSVKNVVNLPNSLSNKDRFNSEYQHINVPFVRFSSSRLSIRLKEMGSPSSRRHISVKSTSIRKYSKMGTSHKTRKRSAFSISKGVLQKQIPHVNSFPNKLSDGSFEPLKNPMIGFSSTCSRKFSVALGRKPSNINTQRKLIRRCSEPFLLDPNVLQEKCYRKNSTARNGKRRQSATASFPSASKQKLHELAKDELLANLIVPSPPTFSFDEKDFEEPFDDVLQAEKYEKERKEVKRQRVMEEILETEKNYISCLQTLDSVFKKQLQELNIITRKDLCSLFPTQLNQILISHTFFMHELQDRMNNVNWRGIIGDIFAKMTSANANLSEIYMNYVQLFPKSISTLSKCTRSSQKFRKFLLDCNENPLVERLDLPSFLLSPVQRLPRYVLLLRELLKYTEEDHPDMYHIAQAKKEMEAMISLLNSSIHSSMEFYSANESRRKKMTRQLTSKKNRKQRIYAEETSFSERKDETQEDETNGGNQSLDSSQCSVSQNSCRSEEGRLSNGNNIRRRKESQAFSRSSIARKSWRRSLGAVFSNLWSTKDEVVGDNGAESKPRSESARFLSISDSYENQYDHTDDVRDRSQNLNRKNGVGTRHQMQPLHALDNSPDIKVHLTVDIEVSSKYSKENIEHKISVSSSQSSDSIKLQDSTQKFKRGQLRGSAGPVLRSILNKAKIQKANSCNELNMDSNIKEKKKQSISSLKLHLSNSRLHNGSPEKHSHSNLKIAQSVIQESELPLPYLRHSTKYLSNDSIKKPFLKCHNDESKEVNNTICEKPLSCGKNEMKSEYTDNRDNRNSKLFQSNNTIDESNNIHTKSLSFEKLSPIFSNNQSENIYIDNQNSEKHVKKSFMNSFKKMIRKK
ncbi:rac guanine nucleotide exchange factor JJ isoform X19 [Hydra vulgaris]|uniref:Rac guanine nucleotide exchange factor JJ isoform X19 n=1 Tax=Hydra vulgaris TaxID=6087 RepID=A0ABM4CIQ8_HYDVU